MANILTSLASKYTTAGLRARIRDYWFIIIGIALYAVGFTIFILPHNIVIGGMAGFSTLVYYATGIPVAIIMYGANCLLLLGGWKVLGRLFVVRTVFGMTVLSVLIGAMEGYFTSHPPLVDDTIMSLALGSVLCGFGIGIYYTHGGTCGGTDIVAAIFSRKGNISMGRVMMIVDVCIVGCSFFLPFDGDMEARVQVRTQTILFGWLSILLYSFIADKYVGAGAQTVQFIIISDNWKDISYRITHELGRGVTLVDGAGYWTGAERKIVLVWCRQRDTRLLYHIVHEVDPNAFVTTSIVRSIYGNGFNPMPIK